MITLITSVLSSLPCLDVKVNYQESACCPTGVGTTSLYPIGYGYIGGAIKYDVTQAANFSSSTKNVIFQCGSGSDESRATTMFQGYLDKAFDKKVSGTVSSTVEAVTSLANKEYEAMMTSSPTDVMVATLAAGGFDAFPYELISARSRKGTVGYNGAAYFDARRFPGVTSQVVAGLEGDALSTANDKTLKALYDYAMGNRGKFVIGLGRLSSGSSSYSSFSVLKQAGIIDSTFGIEPAFAGTVIYHHNGDHDANLWDLVHGRVDVAFTWVIESAVINSDGTFGALTASLFEGKADGELASGNVEEVIAPADFIANFRVAAHTVTPIPNSPLLVLKGGIFDSEAAKDTLTETINFSCFYDDEFCEQSLGDGAKTNSFSRMTTNLYEGWYASVQVISGMKFTNVKQLVTLLIVDDGANKRLVVPKGDKDTRGLVRTDSAITNLFVTTSEKVDPSIACDTFVGADAAVAIQNAKTGIEAALNGLSATVTIHKQELGFVQFLVKFA